jgi:hypothetical protein
MKKLLAALCLIATPAAAMDGSCLDTHVVVSTEAMNLKAFINIREGLQHGAPTDKLVRYLDQLIDMDEKFVAKMTRIGFPGYSAGQCATPSTCPGQKGGVRKTRDVSAWGGSRPIAKRQV